MNNLLNTIKSFFKKKEEYSDLTPRGIRSTIKSPTHGTNEDFNNSFRHIGSQLRNIDGFIKEYTDSTNK
jgi:hypothetical protein